MAVEESYMLKHKISSKYHKAGESQEIIVENIELGRDAGCQVRFDDSFSTVSRRHAAIIREGDKWKLVQLSKTNPTFLNGTKVGIAWYLQDGDEIQLSKGGPKLEFIIPAGKNSTEGSFGLSRRFSLFRQQSLRPYKQAITILSIFLVLAVGGLAGYLFMQDKEHKQALTACEPYVFYIRTSKVVYSYDDETVETDEYGWFGTGFMLDDGRFVTARHVAEPWFFIFNGGDVDQQLLLINKIANNGGEVVAHFTAYSSSGEIFSFRSDQFTCNRRQDDSVMDDDGAIIKIATVGDTDWAYIRTSNTQGLPYNKSRSVSLSRGEELKVLGFPFGLGANTPAHITPHLSGGITTANGLTNGVILTSNSSYEVGNSGGPVFYSEPSGDLSVIGIVSAGAGRSTGFIVPIAAIDNSQN